MIRKVSFVIFVFLLAGLVATLPLPVPILANSQPLSSTPDATGVPDSNTPNKRCGDGICDGPENLANCPADCKAGTPGATRPAPVGSPMPPRTGTRPALTQPASGDGIDWVTNPTSEAALLMQVVRPKNWKGEKLPALVMVPGGIGWSDSFLNPPQKAQTLTDAGFVVVAFDPDGRGQSQGEEDVNGFVQQDGLAAIIRKTASLPEVDPSKIGLVSYSYGVTMATGVLMRYPDLPIRFLIDWEGPVDRYDTTSECQPAGKIPWKDCKDNAFWAEREALVFISNVRVPYQRIQSEKDHVQPDVSHAINIINAAVKSGNSWVRLNDYPINQTYDVKNPPVMLSENATRNLEALVARYAQELMNKK